MIKVENIHRRLDGMEVLRGASIDIADGHFVALIGQSGDGKTVLMKHMAGLMKPDSGRVLVDGSDLCCLSRRRLQRLRDKQHKSEPSTRTRPLSGFIKPAICF
ncbi:MAG: ATP-binding cassette domain-containing protein, partial [Lentisphaeria bacterium]